MLELINELQNEVIIVTTLVIVQLIKDKGWLKKFPTQLLSVLISFALILLSKYLVFPVEYWEAFDTVAVMVLPSATYDIVTRISKPFRN